MTYERGQKGKFSTGSSTIKRALTSLASELTVSGCQRGSGTLAKGDADLRIDMQGKTTAGAYNLQAQIGSSSYAGVFLAPTATDASNADLHAAFVASYGDGYFYVVS